jgi:hypothetical protein
MLAQAAQFLVNYFIERNAQPAPTEIAMSVFRLQERTKGHPSNEVIRRELRFTA